MPLVRRGLTLFVAALAVQLIAGSALMSESMAASSPSAQTATVDSGLQILTLLGTPLMAVGLVMAGIGLLRNRPHRSAPLRPRPQPR